MREKKRVRLSKQHSMVVKLNVVLCCIIHQILIKISITERDQKYVKFHAESFCKRSGILHPSFLEGTIYQVNDTVQKLY